MSGSAFDIELDEMTLARARRGDMQACESIYRLYRGAAYTVAFRICNCPSMAQDVLQEAFINAFKRLKQFRGDAPFWGWLRRVVINQAISMLRKNPKKETVEINDFHAVTEGDEASVELGTDLAAAFGQLDDQDRTVVWLHDVEGYSHAEIAEIFGMTESFSKTRLSRARALLRELLGQSMNPALPEDPGPGQSSSQKHEHGQAGSLRDDKRHDAMTHPRNNLIEEADDRCTNLNLEAAASGA